MCARLNRLRLSRKYLVKWRWLKEPGQLPSLRSWWPRPPPRPPSRLLWPDKPGLTRWPKRSGYLGLM